MRESYHSALAAGIEKRYRQLEYDIMEDIVRRIRKAGKITSTADWQLNRLRILGNSAADIQRMIDQNLGEVKCDELYESVIDEYYTRDRKLYMQSASAEKVVPYEKNEELKQLTSSLISQTNGALKGITRSMGFMLDYGGGKKVWTPLAEIYNQYLDQAAVGIASGAFDYNSMIRKACKQLTDSGLRTDHRFTINPEDDRGIDYPSGWHNRIDVAARRAILTGVSQMAGRINEMNAEALGTEYFEVSWHAGARPDHAVWQGRVYTKKQLETVCGLGTGPGLLGWNCRHEYYPFIPGVSERTYTDEWLEEQNRKEAETKTFRGREYSTYQATQRQRQMETNMRAQREKVKLMQAGDADPDDIVIEKCKYQAQLDEYRNFSKAFGMKTQTERVYYDLHGRIAPGKKQYSAFTAALEKTSFKDVQQSELGEFKKHIALDGRVDKEYYSTLKKRFSHGTDTGKTLFNKYVEKASVANAAYINIPCYNPKTQKVYMNYAADQHNPRGNGVTYFHEHGHYIDAKVGGISGKLDIVKLLDDDIMNYRTKIRKEQGLNTVEKIDAAISSELTSMRKHSAVSDLMDGASGGNIVGIARHPDGYFSKHPEKLGQEAFAHVYEAQFDPVRRNQLRKYFPNTVDQIEKLMEGMIK